MLFLRYIAGSEYGLISEYTRVLNILRVLNMSGLQKVVNIFFHHRYLTGFGIYPEFSIYQCYTGFCSKQPVIHV